MAFLGLIPDEYSSGGTTRKSGMTKAGNVELRWLLHGLIEIMQRTVTG